MTAVPTYITNFQTRFSAFINGEYVPCWMGEVEITAYGTADQCSITTYLADNYTDYGAISQSGKYLPFTVMVGEIGGTGFYGQLLAAYLEEIDTQYDSEGDAGDEIVLHGRGILAPLIDKRLTAKLNQNQDIATSIIELLKSFPSITYNVNDGKLAGVSAGKTLKDDYVAATRNIRVMDYINMLGNAVGWRTRVVGSTVVIGPPPSNPPKLTKIWGTPTGGMKLSIKHNALHAHNIHVRVVGAIQATKRASISVAGPSSAPVTDYMTGETTLFPTGTAPAKARVKAVHSSPIKGVASGSIPVVGEQEEYVFPAGKGKTQAECDEMASKLQAEISRHEFILEMEWAPTQDELNFLCVNGVEWLLELSGCSQQSHNQLYHPKRLNYSYSQDGGITLKVLAINHVLPLGASEGT